MKYLTLYRLISACLIVGLLSACQSSQDGNAAPSQGNREANPSDSIDWQGWTDRELARAQDDSKLVFLYLTTPWCQPCAEMEATSFADSGIRKTLNENYVTIRVNGDRQPNISERYSLGGYPSCVILTPDLRVMGGSMRLSPDSLRSFLDRISDVWKHTPIIAEIQAAKLDSIFREAVNAQRAQRPSEQLLMQAERAIYQHYDSTYGGFGNQPKSPVPEINEFMYEATATNGAPLFKGEVTRILDVQLKLLDPVWGGFYRSARFADWSGTSHEKVLRENAQILSNYVDAFQITKDKKYEQAALQIIEYLDKFLRDRRGWGFYNCQNGSITVDGTMIDPDEYFAKDDSERRSIGLPPVDSTVYLSANCYAISAYLRAGRVLGRDDLVDYALLSLDSIGKFGMRSDGLVWHVVFDSTATSSPLLEDHVALVTALLDAYETSGQRKYLLGADGLAQQIVRRFTHPSGRGLQTDIPDSSAEGRMLIAYRPYGLNVQAIINFVRLFYHTANEAYKQPAEGTFLYLMNVPIRDNDLKLVSLATAYLRITRYPVKLALMGPTGSEYKALTSAIWTDNYPRLIVAHLGDGSATVNYGRLSFAPATKPLLFACGEDTMSSPIVNPDSVSLSIRQFEISLLRKK